MSTYDHLDREVSTRLLQPRDDHHREGAGSA